MDIVRRKLILVTVGTLRVNGKKLFMFTCPMGKRSGKLSGEYKAN